MSKAVDQARALLEQRMEEIERESAAIRKALAGLDGQPRKRRRRRKGAKPGPKPKGATAPAPAPTAD
jgi:hypothetical protein